MSAEIITHPSAVELSLINARAIAKRPDLHDNEVLLDACEMLTAHGDHMDHVLGSMLSRRINLNMSEEIEANLSVVPTIPLVIPLVLFSFAFGVVAAFLVML